MKRLGLIIIVLHLMTFLIFKFMGIIANIFGSKKVIDSSINGIDKAFFTKQEKSEHWISILKSYEPYKLAQRLIALTVVSVYLFVWLICTSTFIMSYWYTDLTDITINLVKYNHSTLSLPFSLIIAFYFGGGAIEGVVNKFKKK